jgi:hypothetical protein
VDERGGFQIFGIQQSHTIDLLGALDIEFVCRTREQPAERALTPTAADYVVM